MSKTMQGVFETSTIAFVLKCMVSLSFYTMCLHFLARLQRSGGTVFVGTAVAVGF